MLNQMNQRRNAESDESAVLLVALPGIKARGSFRTSGEAWITLHSSEKAKIDRSPFTLVFLEGNCDNMACNTGQHLTCFEYGYNLRFLRET